MCVCLGALLLLDTQPAGQHSINGLPAEKFRQREWETHVRRISGRAALTLFLIRFFPLPWHTHPNGVSLLGLYVHSGYIWLSCLIKMYYNSMLSSNNRVCSKPPVCVSLLQVIHVTPTACLLVAMCRAPRLSSPTTTPSPPPWTATEPLAWPTSACLVHPASSMDPLPTRPTQVSEHKPSVIKEQQCNDNSRSIAAWL